MLEKISYIILLTIVLIWILAIILVFIVAFPIGIVFLFILAFGLLFIKVLKDKFSSKDEEEKYKDIKW
jgi:ABC-type bacteriocin/lantibiotic exporter with double-glycine peptidase domain